MHPKAIYLHQGQQFHVERMDFEERKAYVKRVDVDYYTDAIRYTQVRVLEIAERRTSHREHGSAAPICTHRARTAMCWFARKWSDSRRSNSSRNENIGDGKLELPENEMHTTAYWMTLDRALVESLPYSISERQNGMRGLLHAMHSVATLLLMCDGRDLATAIGERPPSPGVTPGREWEAAPSFEEIAAHKDEKEFFEPNLYLFDAYPGGIGFSEPLFRVHALLMKKTRELISGCTCEKGCPSCVGAGSEGNERAKEAALAILDRLGA